MKLKIQFRGGRALPGKVFIGILQSHQQDLQNV